MSLSHGRVPAIRMWRVHRSHRPSSKENSQSKAKQIGIAPHELISVRELGWSLPENGASACLPLRRCRQRRTRVAVSLHRCVLEASRLESGAPSLLNDPRGDTAPPHSPKSKRRAESRCGAERVCDVARCLGGRLRGHDG